MKRWLALASVLVPMLLVGGVTVKRGPRGGTLLYGISGGTGNEETLSALYGLQHFSNYGQRSGTFYFSANDSGYLPQGSDTATCSIDAPCRTLEKLEDLMAATCFGHFIMDTDWWVTSAEFGATWTGSLTPNGSCEDTKDNPAAIISSISQTPQEPFHISCEQLPDTIEATAIALFNAGNGAVTNLAVENAHVYRCPAEPFNATTQSRAMDTMRDNVISLNVFCDQGSIGENNQCATTHTDGGGTHVNTRWLPRSVTDFDSNCAGATCGIASDGDGDNLCTAADTPWTICSAGPPFLASDVAANSSQAFNSAGGKMTVISNHTYTTTMGINFVIGGTSIDFAVIGPAIEKGASHTTTGTTGIFTSCGIDGIVNSNTFYGLTLSGFNDATDAGLQTLVQGAGVGTTCSQTDRVYRTTFGGNTSDLRLGNGGFFANTATERYIERCSIHEGHVTNLAILGGAAMVDPSIIDLSIQHSTYDDDDVVNTYNAHGTNRADISALETALEADDNFLCDGTTDCSTLFSPRTLESPGSQFGAAGALSAFACAQSQLCETNRCPVSLRVDLPTTNDAETGDATLSALYLGTRIRRFVFNGDVDAQLGGR